MHLQWTTPRVVVIYLYINRRDCSLTISLNFKTPVLRNKGDDASLLEEFIIVLNALIGNVSRPDMNLLRAFLPKNITIL